MQVVDTGEGDELASDDHAEFLAAFLSHSLPDDAPPISDSLLEMSVTYLRSLTDVVAPPPPALMDEVWEYYNSVAQAVDEIDPGLVRDHLTFEVFPKLSPLDFTPLDPDGVEGAIQKLVSSRKLKNLAEQLAFVLKGFGKLRGFEPPATLRSSWRKTGPFQLLAMEDRFLIRSVPVADLINEGPPKTISSVLITQRGSIAPKNTDAITIDLKGISLNLTGNRLSGTYSGGFSQAPIYLVNSSWGGGPIHCVVAEEFHPLKSKYYNVRVFAGCSHVPRGDLAGKYFTVAVKVNLKFYAAIIDPDP